MDIKHMDLYVIDPCCKELSSTQRSILKQEKIDMAFIGDLIKAYKPSYPNEYNDPWHYTCFSIHGMWYYVQYYYDDIDNNGDYGISYRQLAYIFELLGFDVHINIGLPECIINMNDFSRCINISDSRSNHEYRMNLLEHYHNLVTNSIKDKEEF